MRRAILTIAVCVFAAACGGKREPKREPEPDPLAVPMHQDAALPRDAPAEWPELASYPRATPLRTIVIPASDAPLFDVGGPVIAGGVAVVSSSRFGFAAVDWRRGGVAWTKPAGVHVAPPLVHEMSVVLVGECVAPPRIPAGEALLGCVRVVTPSGSDEAYLAIRGEPRDTLAFANEKGPQALWSVDDHTIRWRRGDHAVVIDLISGVARPASAEPPPLAVIYQGKRWDITQRDGRIIASGKQPWRTEHPYTAVLGSVWLPGMSPLLRVINLGAFGNVPEVHLIDMDATGSLHAAVGRPTPGIALLGHAVSPQGDAAIAVRIDRSLRRDLVAGYAANAMLLWVYALPEVTRPDPVGLAVTEDAVVVFHDGDILTILPALSAPPTAPGATSGAWKNPTP